MIQKTDPRGEGYCSATLHEARGGRSRTQAKMITDIYNQNVDPERTQEKRTIKNTSKDDHEIYNQNIDPERTHVRKISYLLDPIDILFHISA